MTTLYTDYDEQEIAKAIHENRIFFKGPMQTIEYNFFGERVSKNINLLPLIRIAYQAGIIYGKRKRRSKHD